jgi:hypothetical protein
MNDFLPLLSVLSTLATAWKLAAAVLTALVVMDCLQTVQIARHREHSIEKNPLINGTWRKWLGRPAPYIHPTVAWVIVYFVGVNAGGFWLMGHVPESLRVWPLCLLAAMELYWVASNFHRGLGLWSVWWPAWRRQPPPPQEP